MRTSVGSKLKYSATPPQTPANIRLLFERNNFLFSISFFGFDFEDKDTKKTETLVIFLKTFKGMSNFAVLFVNLQEIRDYSEYTTSRYLSALRKKPFKEDHDLCGPLCYGRIV